MPVATLDDIPLEKAVNYACRDADATLRIYPVLCDAIHAMALEEVYQLDLSVIPMVARMQRVGMRIDHDYFSSLAPYLTDLMKMKVEELNEETRCGVEFNPNSGDQTEELLTGFMRIKLRKKTKSGKRYSTNDKILESLVFKHPQVRIICDYRELAKLRDSFATVLPRMAALDGRVHPNFRITRVSSGRLSCTDPNLLAIPVRTELGKLIRGGFVAGDGRVLGSWDLDQIEMREMAHQSQDPKMLQIFREGKTDVHLQTAAWMFGKSTQDVLPVERYSGKRINFGVITGITEIGLAEQMALAGAEGWDEQRCAEAIREYFKVYRGVRNFLDDCRNEARRYGYVRDRWGRIRYLPGVYSELPFVREEALRQSHSFKISASAQGTLKHAMKSVWDWAVGCGYMVGEPMTAVEPLLQIHDELVFDIKDDKEVIDELNEAVVYFLCNTVPMSVPIKAKGSTGADWGSLKD